MPVLDSNANTKDVALVLSIRNPRVENILDTNAQDYTDVHQIRLKPELKAKPEKPKI